MHSSGSHDPSRRGLDSIQSARSAEPLVQMASYATSLIVDIVMCIFSAIKSHIYCLRNSKNISTRISYITTSLLGG